MGGLCRLGDGAPPIYDAQLFQIYPGDLPLLCCRTLATKADHFRFEYIGDELLFNMKTKDESFFGRCYIDMGYKTLLHAQDYDLVTLSDSLFFPFDDHRQKRLEYEDEKIEMLNFQQNQMDYCVFLLVEQKDKISYRPGLRAMIKAAFKAAGPTFKWIVLG